MRRVVVTGLGIVSPLGVGVENVWRQILAGRSGIAGIQSFDVSDLPAKIAGEVPRGDTASGLFNPDDYVPPKEQKKMDAFITYAIAAAAEAVAAAFKLIETAFTLVEATTAGATPAFIKAHRRKVFRNCSRSHRRGFPPVTPGAARTPGCRTSQAAPTKLLYQIRFAREQFIGRPNQPPHLQHGKGNIH